MLAEFYIQRCVDASHGQTPRLACVPLSLGQGGLPFGGDFEHCPIRESQPHMGSRRLAGRLPFVSPFALRFYFIVCLFRASLVCLLVCRFMQSVALLCCVVRQAVGHARHAPLIRQVGDVG